MDRLTRIDLDAAKNKRIAELEAENMRVGKHSCWLEEQVEYGGGIISNREQRIAELEAEEKQENARLREELVVWMKANISWTAPFPLTVEQTEKRIEELEAKCEKD